MRKAYVLGLLVLSITPLYSLILKDVKGEIPENGNPTTFDILPPYNAFALTVPSPAVLAQVTSKRVLDMAATAYSHHFLEKSLYFYTNVIALFPDDTIAIAWANYEAGFIYFNRRQYNTALDYFDDVLELRGAPTTVQNLSKQMAARIRNRKEFKALRKQEDLLFLADKKARQQLDKQIAKEEREAEKIQIALSKERRRREREEKQALKKAAKEEEKRRKAEEKRQAALEKEFAKDNKK